jgi:hypothetical protein
VGDKSSGATGACVLIDGAAGAINYNS